MSYQQKKLTTLNPDPQVEKKKAIQLKNRHSKHVPVRRQLIRKSPVFSLAHLPITYQEDTLYLL
ncbi:MAG: hypothetical protein M0Q44_21660 [Methylobacter sp.]|jgi:hypothetical protein|nr:hypothetical protein [Methylobacter sp.]